MSQKSIYTILFYISYCLTATFDQTCAAEANIRAWLEDNRVIVNYANNAGQPIPNADVTIYASPRRNRIISGKTDSNGNFSFQVPDMIREGQGLVIDVHDGKEPAREWTLTAAELYAASSLTAGFDEAAISEQMPPVAKSPDTAEKVAQPQSSLPAEKVLAPNSLLQYSSLPASEASISAAEMKQTMQALLQEQLTPMLEKMQATANPSGNLWLYAGIGGWIFGLGALIALALTRRKN